MIRLIAILTRVNVEFLPSFTIFHESGAKSKAIDRLFF